MVGINRTNPLLSIVMPVYNGETYLKEAIESVLSQTYKNFELIIVNDGSSDNSQTIISRYEQRDARVKSLAFSKNCGISKALNSGIMQSRGEYIARMDCDDINFENRFEEQINYFQKNHSQTDVLGTFFCLFFEDVNECKTVPVATSELFNGKPPVHHPTCMIRRSIFEKYGYYDSKFDNAEDYELWLRWFSRGVKFQNLEKVLYKKRIHEGCVSVSRIKHQVLLMLKINLLAVTKYRIKFTMHGYQRILEQLLYLIYLELRLDKIYVKNRKRTT